MKVKLPPVLTGLTLLALSGCTPESGGPEMMNVENAWARPMPVDSGPDGALPGTNSVVYLTIRNDGRDPDLLLSAQTPVAERVEIHESVLAGDVVRMRRVDGIDLPPGEPVELAPGGLHLMLLDLRRTLVAGDSFPLVLTFRDAPPDSVLVDVVGLEPKGMGG